MEHARFGCEGIARGVSPKGIDAISTRPTSSHAESRTAIIAHITLAPLLATTHFTILLIIPTQHANALGRTPVASFLKKVQPTHRARRLKQRAATKRAAYDIENSDDDTMRDSHCLARYPPTVTAVPILPPSHDHNPVHAPPLSWPLPSSSVLCPLSSPPTPPHLPRKTLKVSRT